MRYTREVQSALQMMQLELSGWAIPRSSKTLRFTPPSLLTNQTYAGVPLRRLALPPSPTDLRDVARVFDALIAGDEWQHILNPGLNHFIDANPARLLLWAGTGSMCDLHFSLEENRMMVIGEYSFGFADGMAYGASTDQEYVVDLKQLFEPKEVSTREVGFVALWQRAKRLKKDEALAALAMLRAYKASPWRSIAPWTWSPQVEKDMSKLGEIIYTAYDPIGELYTYIVPKFMADSEFAKKFGDVRNRPLGPDAEYRVQLWRKLSTIK